MIRTPFHLVTSTDKQLQAYCTCALFLSVDALPDLFCGFTVGDCGFTVNSTQRWNSQSLYIKAPQIPKSGVGLVLPRTHLGAVTLPAIK